MPESDPTPEAPSAPATEAKKPAPNAGVRPPNMLGTPTDRAARPGFRDPKNTKSKAQKKRK